MPIESPIAHVLLAVVALFGAGFLSAFLGRLRGLANTLSYGVTLLATLAVFVTALRFLLEGQAPSTGTLPIGLPLLADLANGVPTLQSHFNLDSLSAFFLMLIGFLGALSSLYGWKYGSHDQEPGRVLPLYPLFVGAMTLVTVADDAFSFIVAWELMSLASWFLVLSTHREKATAHAAYVYIVMASFGTFALFLAFGLMAGAGGHYSFAAMRAQELSPLFANGVLLLTLLGAGAKAGIFPLHIWLPLAHPAAPSHVSALMSGVMTKVAIYGVIRILFDLVGAPADWWGGVVMVIGGVTALMGVLYALMQHDLKCLLAYHTVENIGIIFIGLGLALGFQASDMPVLAGLALTAALFHTFNHSLFKSLLFLGSGAVLTATGARDMEKQGGLIHRMPVTALAFLIGSIAISALPPFNGFVSEWLTFQSILSGADFPQWGMKFATPVVGVMLALAAALAAVCFVKVFGVVFLGRARSEEAAQAVEVSPVMYIPLIVLAVLCAVVGMFPSLVLEVLRPVVTALLPSGPLVPLPNSNLLMLVPGAAGGSSYSGAIICVTVISMTILLVIGVHRLASDRIRRSDPWDCGFPNSAPDTQYTASSFAQPIRRIFGTVVFGAKEKVMMPPPGDLQAARFRVTLPDPAWDRLYAPVLVRINRLADRLDASNALSIRLYLGLMFATLVFLLSIVAVTQ